MRKNMQKTTSRFLKKTLTAIVLTISTATITLLSPQTISAQQTTLQQTNDLYHEISYEEELAEAVSVLDLGDITNVTSKLVLPYSYGMHVNIHWKSSDEAVIDLMGNVTTPTGADKDVTLTATLTSTKTDTTKTKDFVVHVPKASVEDVLTQDAKETQEYIDYILNTGYVLPDSEELQIRSEVTWELTSGEAEIKDGKIVKTDNSLERQPIELKATLTFEGQEKVVKMKNITLLDKYAGYILSYFAGKEESKEMYIAYSYDGKRWMRLNNADAVLTPKKGNRQIRDPFIMRKKDGSFAVLATNGWASPMISIWDSENLETFENERLCKVTEKGGIASGFYAWAPEGNYDPITDQYYIYWSDPESNQKECLTLYNTSPDLETMSEYGILYQAPFKEIDASIKKYKGDYYLVHNDSTGDNDTGKGGRRIYLAKADSLEASAFHLYTGALSEAVAEGPFLLQDFRTDGWIVYYDYYQKHKFGITTIDDIRTDNWVYEGICDTMPWDEVRHGGAIAVTQKELDRILDTWALEDPELLSITTPKAVSTKAGSDSSSLNLPATVSVTLSDGNVVDAAVTWDTDDISLKEAGNLYVTGNIETIGTIGNKKYNFTNEENITVEATVMVEKNGSMTGIVGAGCVVVVAVILWIIIKKKTTHSK